MTINLIEKCSFQRINLKNMFATLIIIFLLSQIMISKSLSSSLHFINDKSDVYAKKMSVSDETRICIDICSKCFDYNEYGQAIKVS